MTTLTADTKIRLSQIKWYTQDKHDKADVGTVREWADGKNHIKTFHGWRIATASEVKRAKKLGPIESYTKESKVKAKGKQKRPGKRISIIKNKAELHAAIEKYKNDKTEVKYNLGKLKPLTKRRIKAKTGLDPENMILETDIIPHVEQLKHNLKPGDIELIPEIVNTTTNITLSNKKNTRGNPVILFKQNEQNGLIIAMEYRSKKLELGLVTAYRIKK